MDDTISRQAAIEAICKACLMTEDYHKCDGYPETSTWCDELVALRALPSAEPYIIRCKDCKYYDAEERLCNDLMGFGRYWSENDFCSFAERKDDE